MSARPPAFRVARSAALLTLGALAVHQLRYLIAYGPAGGEALHREGHGYLAQALPVIVALAMATLVAGLLVAALARAPRPAAAGAGRGFLYAAGLMAVFSTQELAEGALAQGHPAGLAALFAGGAWISVPLSLALGFLAAAAERLLDRTETAIAVALAATPRPSRPPEPSPPRAAAARNPLASRPLAFGLARRPPPLAPIG